MSQACETEQISADDLCAAISKHTSSKLNVKSFKEVISSKFTRLCTIDTDQGHAHIHVRKQLRSAQVSFDSGSEHLAISLAF